MRIRPIAIFGIAAALFASSAVVSAQKLTAEEVISKHLDSIAPAEKRAATKTFVTTGEVRVEYVTQKNQSATGRVVMASEGQKVFFGLGLNAADYAEEKMVFDGNKVTVNFIRPGVRSDLGNFVQANSELLSHGLMGGSLSTAWPLLNAATAKAKITYGGEKKVEGKEAYSLKYSPKGGNDVEITMYFDKATFRHIRTEYKRTMSGAIGVNINDSARISESRLKVVEDFSDFKDFEGRTVPQKYKFAYTFTGSNGTKEVTWHYDLMDFAVNQALSAETFVLAK